MVEPIDTKDLEAMQSRILESIRGAVANGTLSGFGKGYEKCTQANLSRLHAAVTRRFVTAGAAPDKARIYATESIEAYAFRLNSDWPGIDRYLSARVFNGHIRRLNQATGSSFPTQPEGSDPDGTVRIDPTPDPSPSPTGEPEPAPVHIATAPPFKMPTRPGYIVPAEYGMIDYCLQNRIHFLITGAASAGKTLSIEVACETNEYNYVRIGKIESDVMIKGFMNPLTKEFVPSLLIKALQKDPEVCKYPGHPVVILFDEAFSNNPSHLILLLTLLEDDGRGYLATEMGPIPVENTVFVFIDNSVGDGGDTNYVSRSAVDQAFKSRLFMVHMELDKRVAKSICGDDTELYDYSVWVRKSIQKGRIDRLSLDNRGLRMIMGMRNCPRPPKMSDERFTMDLLSGAFFKGCPVASMATLIRGIDASPDKRNANRYYKATVAYYTDLCKNLGVQADPKLIQQ